MQSNVIDKEFRDYMEVTFQMDTGNFLTRNEGTTNGRKTLFLSVREHFDRMGVK